MEDLELSAAGSAAFHLELLEREPEFPRTRDADDRARSASVDENGDRMATERAGGVEMADRATRERYLSEALLSEKSGERHKHERFNDKQEQGELGKSPGKTAD